MITFDDIKYRRKPDFNEMLRVLRREKPGRPVLFEIFLEQHLIEAVNGKGYDPFDEAGRFAALIEAAHALGYDYTSIHASDFRFPSGRSKHGLESVSLNEGAVITDRRSFDAFAWQDPTQWYRGRVEKLAPLLPEGMKFIVMGPGGVLENVISLTGFDNLCFMLADDADLVEELFRSVGTRLVDYYRQIIDHDSVGAIISNDDWGYKLQTMLSPADMRRFVFPYHKRIAKVAHDAGKPVILHSCGNLREVMDDVIDDMDYDAKHSFEDVIQPVEEAYDRYHHRIALMGGMDLDFICRSTPEAVFERSRAMLEKTGSTGYAMGSGNSIPPYTPHANYLAMIGAAVLDWA